MSQPDAYCDYLKPGVRIWAILNDPETGKSIKCGLDGTFVYEGYQVIGTVTFMLVSQIVGVGKKSSQRSLTINAADVRRIGKYEEIANTSS